MVEDSVSGYHISLFIHFEYEVKIRSVYDEGSIDPFEESTREGEYVGSFVASSAVTQTEAAGWP